MPTRRSAQAHPVALICFLAVMGLSLLLTLAWMNRARLTVGNNDFLGLYVGGRLVGTGHLYDSAAVTQVQLKTAGFAGDSLKFIRLPYYAATLWPLARLPYLSAFLLWELLNAAAIGVFVWLWRPTPPATTLAFTMFSFPLLFGVLGGQDLAPVLVALAASVRLHRQGRDFVAGMALSLCSIKFHLFLLLPVVLLAGRRWRITQGLLAGGGILAAVSFLVEGVSWPVIYWRVLVNPGITPRIENMPNLQSLCVHAPCAGFVEAALCLAVAAMVWGFARRTSWECGLAVILCGGLLTSHHAYLADAAVLLPAALILLTATASTLVRVAGVILLSPPAYCLLFTDQPFFPVCLTLFFGLLFCYRSSFPAEKGSSEDFVENRRGMVGAQGLEPRTSSV